MRPKIGIGLGGIGGREDVMVDDGHMMTLLSMNDLISLEDQLLEFVQNLLKYFTQHRDLFYDDDVIQLLRVTQPFALFPSASDDRVILRTDKTTLNSFFNALFQLYLAIPPFKEALKKELNRKLP